jgi:hypothetical protein
MFEKKNAHGNPRLMSFLENKIIFDVILSEFNPKELEHIRDRFNNNIYTYIIKYNYNVTKIVPPYAYVEVDSSGKNALMKFCELIPINESLINKLCETEQSDKLLNMYDNDGNSGYHYIARYTKTVLNKLIEHKIFNLSTFIIVNRYNETLLMYAIKYNTNNAIVLLNYDELSECQFFSDYSSGSVLTYSVKYNHSIFDKIVSHKSFNYNIMKIKDKVENIIEKNSSEMFVVTPVLNLLHITCLQNVDILKKVIKLSNKMTTILMNEEIFVDGHKTNALLIALFNNPDCAQYLSGIAICDDEYIDKSIKLLNDDLRILIDYQPYSLYYITISSKFKGKYNLKNDVHYYGYNPDALFENQKSLKYMLQFIQDKQELPTSEKDTCPVCVTFKTKVLNISCKHSTCISCSLKTQKCAICRNVHENTDGQSLRILI